MKNILILLEIYLRTVIPVVEPITANILSLSFNNCTNISSIKPDSFPLLHIVTYCDILIELKQKKVIDLGFITAILDRTGVWT